MEPDDLYGLPLARFVPERGALAKALRAEGRRDEAAQVAKLRKPSAAAWAVNQLVRTQGRAVSGLFDAGDTVRAAQTGVLAGKGDARALRDAGAREREAVASLVQTARGLLSEEGQELSATTLERVAGTLHAAALDDASREQVRDGRLERELQHIGLGLGEGPAVAAPAPRTPPPKKQPAPADREAEKQAKQERAAAAAAEQARRTAARAVLARAVKRAERADAALRAAEERRERAAAALVEADEALEAARAAASEAAEERREAQAASSE